MENNIFRFPYLRSKDKSAITLLSASNMDEEADFVTAKIRELIFNNILDEKEKEPEKEIRYENIAVLTGSLDSYGSILERKFRNAGIPIFIDEKHSISGMNIVDFIDSIIDTEIFDYSYESVFRFLKTGLTDVDRDETARMENYVIARGKKGSRQWKQEWKKGSADIEAINKTREKTVEILAPYRDIEKKNPTVTQRLTAIYNILDNCRVEEKIYNLSESLKQSRDIKERIKGTEFGQVFKTIVTVFERINGLLGEERMELSEFKDVLDTGFSEAKLRRIPGGADSVVIGDIERTRIDNKKVIFFVGCNDSVIPKNTSKEGLLNEFDRELFAENDIELSPTKRDSATLNEFYLYLALTKPSEKLFITFARSSADDKEARPAYIFGRIMKLYEDLKIQRLSKYEPENIYRLLGSDNGLSTVIAGLRNGYISESDGKSISENPAVIGFLKDILKEESPKLMSFIEDAVSGKRKRTNLKREEAEELYGRIIIGSITRLQLFAACAFSHFATYGLKLKERQEYKISGLEIGNIYHAALQHYALGLKNDKKKWTDCIDDERDKREDAAIEKALSEYNDIIDSTRRLEYFRTSIKRVISRTVDTVTKQIGCGEFDVGFVEKVLPTRAH